MLAEDDTGKVPENANPSFSSSPELVSRMKLNDNKAGMEGLDREKINKIIYEASKGSSYYKNELKREEQVNKRIERQKEQLAKITPQQIVQGEIEADKLVLQLEAERDMTRTMVHIDMDAFYAAVETRDNPALKDKPMAVGGNAMLCTSNYLARRYGVRAAMPGFIARKLCPELIIVPTNFEKYIAVSKHVREILAKYDPNYVPMSLDEAYFDITEHLKKRENYSKEQRTFVVKRKKEQCCTCASKSPTKFNASHELGTQSHSSSDTSELESLPVPLSAKVPVYNDSSASTGEICCHGSENVDEDNQLITSGSSSTVVESPYYQTDDVDLNKKGVIIEAQDRTETLGEKTESSLPMLTKQVNNSKCRNCGRFVSDDELKTFGIGAEETVNEVRARIEMATDLTASAGIAPNTMLAKVCSDKNKPNGQFRIMPNKEAVMEFISELSTRKICGIGKVSEKLLNALGIEKCCDLYRERAILYHLYSKIAFTSFMKISMGISSNRLESDSERKSMSTERTFREISNPQELYKKCSELCENLAEDLQEHDLKGKTVAIKLKTVQFKVLTRAKTLTFFTNDSAAMYETASELLKIEIQAHNPLKLRLMGVRMSSFSGQFELDSGQNTIKEFFKKTENQKVEQDQIQDSVFNLESSAATQLETKNNGGKMKKSKLSGQISINSLFQKGAVSDAIGTSSVVRANNADYNVTEQKEESSEIFTQFFCPVCNLEQDVVNLESFNHHVDACLNRNAVQEILAQERLPNSAQGSAMKRNGDDPKSQPQAKKRKKMEKGLVKIETFFK